MNSSLDKVQQTKIELVELNKKFHDKSLLPSEFYSQLAKQGLSYTDCILFSIVPDGSNTYFGKLVCRGLKVFEFDVDLDSENYSEWNDISQSLSKKNRLKLKPWSEEVIALDLLSEIVE